MTRQAKVELRTQLAGAVCCCTPAEQGVFSAMPVCTVGVVLCFVTSYVVCCDCSEMKKKRKGSSSSTDHFLRFFIQFNGKNRKKKEGGAGHDIRACSWTP